MRLRAENAHLLNTWEVCIRYEQCNGFEFGRGASSVLKRDASALGERDAPSDTAGRILAAGIDEFGRLGFAGASTSRIVEAAGCNVRMLYHYYSSKEGLYRAALERVYADLRRAERMLGFEERDPRDGLARFVAFTFDYMLEHPEFPRMMRVENLNEGRVVRTMPEIFDASRPLMTRLAGLVEAGIEQGVFRRRVAPEHLYLSILGLSFVHISNQHTAAALLGLDFDAAEFLAVRRAEAIALVLAGLQAETATPVG